MNKFAEAFNMRAEDSAFDIAIAKYLNSGGTIERALERVRIAAGRMSGRGLSGSASDGQTRFAPTRQPVEDVVADTCLPDRANTPVPASSFNRGGEGPTHLAQSRPALSALPVREPSSSQRTVAGMIAKAAAVTVLDTLKIDGRAIGDWTVAEARAAGKTKTREGRILIEASRMVANAPANALIRDVVKANELQLIMQKAAEVSDAA